jgi:hypothetical protein
MCIRVTIILGNIIVETSDVMLPYWDFIWVQIANWRETYIGPNFPNEDAAHIETTPIQKCSEPSETYFVEFAWEYFTCHCWNELRLKLIFFSVWKLANHCNTKKKLERGSGVDQKFDFLNRCSDDRSETADAKISSKRNRFDIHMLDSDVRWITCE